jgi:hypothetical protein
MFFHRPRRVEVVILEIRITTILNGTAEPDFAPKLSSEGDWRSPGEMVRWSRHVPAC